MDYYVNISAGSDTNPGTEGGPFETVDHLLTVASPGDNIFLARGFVYPAILISSKNGTVSNPYTWGAYGIGSDPVISAFIEPSTWVDEGSNIWSYTNVGFSEVKVVSHDNMNLPVGRWPKRSVAEYYDIDSSTGNTQITDNTNLSGEPSYVGGELVTKKQKWTIDRSPITAQTATTITVIGSGSNFVTGNGYFVQNNINCLTEQDDWCFESTSNLII